MSQHTDNFIVLENYTAIVAVDLSNFRNCGDSIGQVSWNRSRNPPTQSSYIEGSPRISTEQLFQKTTTNTRLLEV